VEQTLELVLRPPTGGAVVAGDPLPALMVTMAAIWLFGTPWLRLCWWLGARARRRPAS
jgi:hypothetical protein